MSIGMDPPIAAVRETVERALAEDLGPLGDLTASLVPAVAVAVGVFVARDAGVLAGTACATETYAQLDAAVTVEWSTHDGEALAPGAVIARVAGPLRSVLSGERTALNFLCHLSGIATVTRRFVDAAAGRIAVCDTRKTLPGLRALEKAAVRAGGGVNHRGSLSDMVLLKDNHLAGVGIKEAVLKARERWPGRGIEVECEHREHVEAAIAAGADVVMLDNMTPDDAGDLVAMVRTGPRPETAIEISGGVTIDTIARFAETGADVCSTSAITQSAPALDIGLDLNVET